jgi:dTDP-4-dehydrorhamnose 3,5-epimerase-like enzyme
MNIKYYNFDIKSDEECECGSLIAIEELKDIPFEIKRIFYIYGVDSSQTRGAHAHKDSNQILISVNGSCEIVFDDGTNQQNIVLDEPNKGIYQEKMIWGEMKKFSKDCVLMVISDSLYDDSDYIRDYDEFLGLCKRSS